MVISMLIALLLYFLMITKLLAVLSDPVNLFSVSDPDPRIRDFKYRILVRYVFLIDQNKYLFTFFDQTSYDTYN